MGKGLAGRCLSMTLQALLLCACTVGPNYVPVPVALPDRYKEGALPPPGWKIATPQDELDRGPWWEIFGNAELNSLEARLNVCNQNIAAAQAQYLQAVALAAEARAAVFPVLSGFVSFMRQKPAASSFNANSGTGIGGVTQTSLQSLPPYSTYLLNFDGSWEPDLWGGIRRSMEASSDTAQASDAQVAAVRLSSQALLAQNYFQLRTLDALQQLLDDIVKANQKLLALTQGRYRAGTASLADIAQAQATLQAAQASAINNGVSRAQLEHAIAVLIGVPPAEFSLPPKVIHLRPPVIPAQIPSALLERRPDIAQAERNVAAANAQIGVAIASFYPTLPLTGSFGFQSNKFPLWFSNPASFWILGAELMDTILDGGLRAAQVSAARATYGQMAATYRQTVLTAFQNVEDNLAAQRILREEEKVQRQAVATAKLSLRLTRDDYQAGTVDFTSVLVAQTSAFSIEQNEVTLVGNQMTAAVGLITSLGGGWNVCTILIKPPLIGHHS